MSSQDWRLVAGILAPGTPALSDQDKEMSKVLFEGYSEQDIDKAMSLFHAFCQTTSGSDLEHNNTVKVAVYKCAASVVDSLES